VSTLASISVAYRKSRAIHRLLVVCIYMTGSVCSLHAQSPTPGVPVARPKAIYTPTPVYRPEWARQGLSGKGVVLVTIDKGPGTVTGARMLQSTGSSQLDGSALQAYSQWRFEPGTVSQLKMPIEFTNRPNPQKINSPPKRERLYPLLILLGVALTVMAVLKTRKATE
jgi:TonB family protein